MGRLTSIVITITVLATTSSSQTKPTGAKDVLEKTFASYAAAKSYQGKWTYVTARDGSSQTMNIEIKSKAPNKLFFRVSPSPGEKPAPDLTAIPEMLVVIDGKTAWFYNVSDNAYFMVNLPAKAQVSPLLFLPQMKSTTAVERDPDRTQNGKSVVTVHAGSPNGGTTRMEISGESFHILRIVKEDPVGTAKITSTISTVTESFNTDAPDADFVFKAPRGAKLIPPSLSAEALFGPSK